MGLLGVQIEDVRPVHEKDHKTKKSHKHKKVWGVEHAHDQFMQVGAPSLVES